MKLLEASEFIEQKGVAGARTFLRSAREAAKVSQLELSRLSRVPQPNLNRIESGEQEGFTARTFVRLYNAIEKRLVANHRHARRAEKLMQLSQKYGPLPQRELLALLRKEENAAREERFAAFDKLNPLARYAVLQAVAEGKATIDSAGGISANIYYHTLFRQLNEQEIDRKRQLAALEAARSIDDPVIQEIIESYRREIEELEKTTELLSRELAKANADSDD